LRCGSPAIQVTWWIPGVGVGSVITHLEAAQLLQFVLTPVLPDACGNSPHGRPRYLFAL
jgi:hypothetical protein